VAFNGTIPPKWNVQVVTDNFMTVVVPTGATTGRIVVQENNGTTATTLSTPYNFTLPCSGILCVHIP
jgi:hypothetical protein